MNANEAFPSKWLKAEDFEDGERRVVTIARITTETLGTPPKVDIKPTLHFEDFDGTLPLPCNKTNWKTLIKLLGNETDDWIGRKITLFTTEVQFKDDMVMSVRVGLQLPKNGAKTSKTETPADFKKEGQSNNLPAEQMRNAAREAAKGAKKPPVEEDETDPFDGDE